MGTKRILIVDDSSLFQRLLSDVVNARPGLEVVGVAANGRVALEMMPDLKPDLVTLDILMPELDGIQTLIEITRRWPAVRTIMVSSLTPKGSDAALDALALGANEYAVKPFSNKGIEGIRYELEQDFLPKLEGLCGLEAVEHCRLSERLEASNIPPAVSVPVLEAIQQPVQLVAIGVSTGGPDALGKLLPQLPVDLEVPVVIVQHMPADFTAKLASRLNASCALEVAEAKHGEKLKPGFVYLAPGDYHMVLENSFDDATISLNQNPPENSCRPSVDPLFRSISEIFGDQSLGVVMTGMGQDGLKGAEALYAAGSRILVQDQESSIVWGMPKLVAMAGLAEEEVSLSKLAGAILARVRPRVDTGLGLSSPRLKSSGLSEATCSIGTQGNLS